MRSPLLCFSQGHSHNLYRNTREVFLFAPIVEWQKMSTRLSTCAADGEMPCQGTEETERVE